MGEIKDNLSIPHEPKIYSTLTTIVYIDHGEQHSNTTKN